MDSVSAVREIVQAVDGAAVVGHLAAVDDVGARVGEARLGGDGAVVESRGRGHDLERRAGHEEALQGTVEERRRGVARVVVPAGLEAAQVEARRRGRGDHGAGARVERDHGALLPLQRLLRGALHGGHQGEAHVGAVRAPAEDAVDPALRAELEALAGQELVELGLEPGAPVAHAVVAEQVRGERALRVAAPVVAGAPHRAGEHAAVVGEQFAAGVLHLLGDAAMVLGRGAQVLGAHDHPVRQIDDERDEEHGGDHEDPGDGTVHGLTSAPPGAGAGPRRPSARRRCGARP